MILRFGKSVLRWHKLLILWILFSFQLLLIGIFIIFGSSNGEDSYADDSTSATYRSHADSSRPAKVIRFIENVYISNRVNATTAASALSLPPIPEFEKGFFKCSRDAQLNDTQYCFRNGSVESVVESLNDYGECVCKCHLHYHGKDCGQPEVVWRGFISARISRTDHSDSLPSVVDLGRRPFRVFYMIHATALSLTTVEIQMMETNDMVDYFILCDEVQSNAVDASENSIKHRSFRYHQLSSEHRSDFLLKRLKAKVLILETADVCTPKWMYESFRRRMGQTASANDILLFSEADEIVSRQAILYMKWYDDWTRNQPIRFRLKHNVYGFYWQHPNQTTVRSGACQLHVLDEQFGRDPWKMVNESGSGMIIGDLNHAGGWLCSYCYESTLQVVQKLQVDRATEVFRGKEAAIGGISNARRGSSVVDEAYIETLIAAGIYLDGKTNLLRNHRFSDKYYAPDTVTGMAWKYEPMLSNTYAHYDADEDN